MNGVVSVAEAEALAVLLREAVDEYHPPCGQPAETCWRAVVYAQIGDDTQGLRQCETDLSGDDADEHARRYSDDLTRIAVYLGVS